MYETRDGLTILEGLEPIQRRPAMYIGAAEPGRSLSHRLLEGLVEAIAGDTPPPQEIRVGLWSGSALTVAWDGVPLPIEPFDRSGEGVSHPALYQLFMHLAAGTPPFDRFFFGAILNALSERLVVSTMHGDHRYRAVFAKGHGSCASSTHEPQSSFWNQLVHISPCHGDHRWRFGNMGRYPARRRADWTAGKPANSY